MRDNGILEFLSTVVGIHSNEPQFCSMAAAVSSAMLSNGEAEYEDEISTDETSESETSSDSGGYPSGDFDEIVRFPPTLILFMASWKELWKAQPVPWPF